MAELFQYRFNQGDGLKGHSFGNLFIAAMNDLTRSFPEALMQSSKILAVKGEIIPATLQNLKLTAKLEDGEEIQALILRRAIHSGRTPPSRRKP